VTGGHGRRARAVFETSCCTVRKDRYAAARCGRELGNRAASTFFTWATGIASTFYHNTVYSRLLSYFAVLLPSFARISGSSWRAASFSTVRRRSSSLWIHQHLQRQRLRGSALGGQAAACCTLRAAASFACWQLGLRGRQHSLLLLALLAVLDAHQHRAYFSTNVRKASSPYSARHSSISVRA